MQKLLLTKPDLQKMSDLIAQGYKPHTAAQLLVIPKVSPHYITKHYKLYQKVLAEESPSLKLSYLDSFFPEWLNDRQDGAAHKCPHDYIYRGTFPYGKWLQLKEEKKDYKQESLSLMMQLIPTAKTYRDLHAYLSEWLELGVSVPLPDNMVDYQIVEL